MQGCGTVWGAPLEDARKNPPLLALFCMFTRATPLRVVEKWFWANHHMFTLLFGGWVSVVSETVFFPGFPHPHLLLEGGFWQSLCPLSAPFVCPSCTPLVCVRALFGYPFCPPFVHWNPLSAPFLRDSCKKGTNCIHAGQIWFLKRTCSAFFFDPLWPRQGQAFAGRSVLYPHIKGLHVHYTG